jgi:hypothetical protein
MVQAGNPFVAISWSLAGIRVLNERVLPVGSFAIHTCGISFALVERGPTGVREWW